MTDEHVDPDSGENVIVAQIDQPANRRGALSIAWSVIVVIVLMTVLSPRDVPESEANGGHQITDKIFEFQGKYLVAAASFSDATKEKLYDQSATQLNTGPVKSRLRFVTLAGELAGREEALEKLTELEQKIRNEHVNITDNEAKTISILRELYSRHKVNPNGLGGLTCEQERFLTDSLGWFGELSLTPDSSFAASERSRVLQPATTTMIAILSLMGLGFLLVIGGVVSGIIFVILAWTGKLQAVHGEISPSHGIYIEAFAVWLLLHQIIGLFAGLIVTETNTMVVSAGGLMVTGIAAFWPVVRGVTWKQMCADIGLHRGTKNWLFEIVFGMVGYVTMLPFLLLNGLILILVMKLMSQGQANEFAMPQMPSHPLNEWVTESGWFAKFMIIFLASGVAPVLEETMFRGFLYRHLRDAWGHWRPFLSIAASALLSSFIFAVIHPQGWIAVPALTTTAIGFCLLREWRGSLIAPMTAHALHNGVATVMIMIILGAA